jgi:L-fuconolactonase
MQVDTHVHFGKYNWKEDAWINNDMKILQQNYLPETIEQTFRRNDIDVHVAVQVEQASGDAFLVELAKTHPVG